MGQRAIFENQSKIIFRQKIFCNSKFTKKFIDNKLNVQSEILYPPVDLHAVKGVKKENIILHVGRFDVNEQGVNYKKQDVMIEMFKKWSTPDLKTGSFKLVLGVADKDLDKLEEYKKMVSGYPVELIVNIPTRNFGSIIRKPRFIGMRQDMERTWKDIPKKQSISGLQRLKPWDRA